MFQLAKDLDEASKSCLLSPFLAIVAKPQDWTEYGSHEKHKADECDFIAHSLLGGSVHKAYMASGSGCTGLAAMLPGTVLHDVSRDLGTEGKVRIGHPSGTLEVDVAYEKIDDSYHIKRAALIRTARRISKGVVFTAADRLPWMKEAGDRASVDTSSTSAGQQEATRSELFQAM